MNPYIAYYRNQGGSGLTGFEGVRYQRGSGFFSRLASRTLLPLLKFLGKRVLSGGVNLASDVLAGQNFKDSVKQRLRETGKNVATDALNYANETVFQTGSGRNRMPRRRRRTMTGRFVKSRKRRSSSHRKRRTATTRAKAPKRRKIYKKRHTHRRRRIASDFLSL